jgi:hypothetical protein
MAHFAKVARLADLPPGTGMMVVGPFDLSGLVIKGVSFSGNVKKALGTIVQQVSPAPPVYLVELLFSFKGIKRVEMPGERIHLD